MKQHSADSVRAFFASSSWLDQLVLRPLSHIAPNWEVRWDEGLKRYRPEVGSFAEDLNRVAELVATCQRPLKYHEQEDILAENVVRELKWPVQKKNGRWQGEEYAAVLEQGAFDDLDQRNLIAAAVGRVHAALDVGQKHFDDMEDGHFYMLATLLSIIIYHRYSVGEAVFMDEDDTA